MRRPIDVKELRRTFDASFAEPIAAAQTDEAGLLSIRAGDRPMAVRIEEIAAVSKCPRVTPVPSAQPALLGLAGVRGMLITVYSLAALLDERPGGARWLVLAAADPSAGLSFDELIGYERAPRSATRAGAVVTLRGVPHTVVSVAAIIGSIRQRAGRAQTQPGGLSSSDGE